MNAKTVFMFLVATLMAANVHGADFPMPGDNDKWEYLVKPVYDDVKHPVHQYLSIRNDSLFGMVDMNGNEVIAPSHKGFILFFNNGLGSVYNSKDGNESRCGYIDKSDKIIIPMQYKRCDIFSDGKAIVTTVNEEMFFINASGERISETYDYVDFDDDTMSYFSEGLSPAYLSRKSCGYINKSLTFKIPATYSNCGKFREGYAVVATDASEGESFFISTDGSPAFGGLKLASGNTRFENSMAIINVVKPYGKGNKKRIYYGAINKSGQVVVEIKYKKLEDYNAAGYTSFTKTDGTTGYLDRKGNEYATAKETPKEILANTPLWKLLDHKWSKRTGNKVSYGYKSYLGEEVIPPIFDKTYPFFNGRARVKINGKEGLIQLRK
ncbi:MAG: WG repeat-containing protein [Gallionellaceae bacterium]